MNISDLPTINALLNASSATFLFIGWRYIRRGQRESHKKCMLTAVGFSTLFLISYLFYHYHHGATVFAATGWIRPVYFSILISHTILATAVLPLVLITLVRGLRARYDKHRRIARWTFPIWLYVSVTGVVVYLILYHFYPPPTL